MDLLVSAAASYAGAVRPVNEDRVVNRSPVFLVADGISGCQQGELASGLVADYFEALAQRTDLTPEIVADAVMDVHDRVRQSQHDDGHRSATTLAAVVALWMGEVPYWMITNSGDSRVYRVSGAQRRLVTVTEDHTHAQGLLSLGALTTEEAACHPQRHVLTQAVGSADHFDPDFWLVPIIAGEQLLLCTDGLLGETDLVQWSAIVTRRDPPEETAAQLVSLALDAGAKDNISVVVVDVAQRRPRGHD